MAGWVMTKEEQLLAAEFLQHATEFVEAGGRLYRSAPPFLLHPTFYCVAHGVELALKSYLAAHGYSKKQLASRQFGHDLASLLNEALRWGTLQSRISPANQRTVSQSGKSYSRKAFEYPELLSTAGIGNWLSLADTLLDCARMTLEGYSAAHSIRLESPGNA